MQRFGDLQCLRPTEVLAEGAKSFRLCVSRLLAGAESSSSRCSGLQAGPACTSRTCCTLRCAGSRRALRRAAHLPVQGSAPLPVRGGLGAARPNPRRAAPGAARAARPRGCQGPVYPGDGASESRRRSLEPAPPEDCGAPAGSPGCSCCRGYGDGSSGTAALEPRRPAGRLALS